MTYIPDTQKLAHSPIIELFELSEYDSANPNIFRFCNLSTVVWQGNTYQALPCEATGFEFRTGGALPRPHIKISNIGNIVSSLIATYNDLVGAKLTRKRTLEKYLDGMPTANPIAAFPNDIWYVDRKVVEVNTGEQPIVEWELVSSLDLEGLELPRRTIVSSACTWKYRSSECSYTGTPIAKIDDSITADINQDQCGKRIASCKLRFGENSVLPFGGFPGATRYT